MCFTYWFEREHFNQDSLEHFTEGYLMLFHTNTPHVHIHGLGITVILSPEILLLYQLQMNANGYSLQPILSQWASSIKKPLAERKAAKETSPILPMKATQHLPFRWQYHSCWSAKTLEHVGSNSPHPVEKPLPCHHLELLIFMGTENPLLDHQSTFFKINFFWLWKQIKSQKTQRLLKHNKTLEAS